MPSINKPKRRVADSMKCVTSGRDLAESPHYRSVITGCRNYIPVAVLMNCYRNILTLSIVHFTTLVFNKTVLETLTVNCKASGVGGSWQM